MKRDCVDHGCKGYGLGYATAKYQGRYTTKHRVVYLKHHGMNFDDLGDLVVRHKCDNPRCINIHHLEAGTHQDNMGDMVSRGRAARVMNAHPGESNGRAVLTDAQCEEIRHLYVKGSREFGCTALAKRFGVGTSQIWRVANRCQRN